MIYTAWCRDADGTGTVWICQIDAEDVDGAIQKAREECAADWEYPVEAVECIGLAEGHVKILHWEDEL